MERVQMERVPRSRIGELRALQIAYKAEIGEGVPAMEDLDRLEEAVREEKILFYGCVCEGRLVGCCSLCRVFSTFQYGSAGVLEDFYILPEFRHQGIARRLVRFAYEQSGVTSMTVGCADCDREMYGALGFSIPLGHMLAYKAEN